MWLSPSWILLSMSLSSKRGVIQITDNIKWFYRVSHPIMSASAPVAEYTASVPPYEKVIVEQQWARHLPNPFQIIDNIRRKVEGAMEIPDVFSNPLVIGVMEGIQFEYSIMQEVPVPRRRIMSHSPQED